MEDFNYDIEHMVLIKILTKISSNVKYISGNNYSDIVWIDDNNKLSKDYILNKINEYKQDKPFQILRKKRNKILSESDFKAMPDYIHSSEEVKQAWITYRQALRDLPSSSTPQLDTNGELINIPWPTPPS
tara:strand:+ start:605 stop:994 length:390 start_codon:yes stop_codon:yes gene_type:complete